MSPAGRLARDVAAASALVLAAAATLVLVVDGVEQWHLVVSGHLAPLAWVRQLLGRLPDHLLLATPVCAALGAASVAEQWRRTDRLVAVAAAGVSPLSLTLRAGFSVVLLAVSITALRELASVWSDPPVDNTTSWTELDPPHPAGVDQRLVRAEAVGDALATDVEIAWLSAGAVVGRVAIPSASWNGATWHADEVRAASWLDKPASSDALLDLPDPAIWRARAALPEASWSLGELAGAPASPARSSWLGERLSMPLAAGLLALIALLWVPTSPRAGAPGAIGLAVAWRLVDTGVVAAASRGGWPVLLTLGALLAALAVGVGLAAWRARYLATTK